MRKEILRDQEVIIAFCFLVVAILFLAGGRNPLLQRGITDACGACFFPNLFAFSLIPLSIATIYFRIKAAPGEKNGEATPRKLAYFFLLAALASLILYLGGFIVMGLVTFLLAGSYPSVKESVILERGTFRRDLLAFQRASGSSFPRGSFSKGVGPCLSCLPGFPISSPFTHFPLVVSVLGLHRWFPVWPHGDHGGRHPGAPVLSLPAEQGSSSWRRSSSRPYKAVPSAPYCGTHRAPCLGGLCFDGYPMTKQGKAGKAIGLAQISSFMGLMVGWLFLATLSPAIAKVALQSALLSTSIAVFGISIVAVLCSDSPMKGWISAFLGILITTIGIDPIDGVPCFTFDTVLLSGEFLMSPS